MIEYIKPLVFVVIFGLGIAWAVFQWNECIDMGHSMFYCIQHILG